MEKYCLTGQSSQWALVPMKEEEEERRIAWDQKYKADKKVNFIFKFPLQEVFPFKNLFFTSILKNFLCSN
jgi:hypothetical protein